MTKIQDLATAFLQKAQGARPVGPIVSKGPINAFNALFAVEELNEQDNRAVERILVEGYEPGLFPEESVDPDVLEVKRLTKELRAIKRQELVLIGERIAQARDIFRKYRERSFREWLELTFGSFKSGYNYLAFYDLYLAVPDEVKARLKEMPAKAAYILASRKAPLESKIEIVTSCGQKTASGLISFIQNRLNTGLLKRPAKKISNERIIGSLERGASTILPESLDEFQRRRLSALIDHLKDLLTASKLG